MCGVTAKRPREDESTTTKTTTTTKPKKRTSSSVLGISRSISACKRCRNKKIRCSHDFPKCTGCQKANVECVSIDPATGREIPRSYITHLENKVEELERQLKLAKEIASATPSGGLSVSLQTASLNNNNNNNNIRSNDVPFDQLQLRQQQAQQQQHYHSPDGLPSSSPENHLIPDGAGGHKLEPGIVNNTATHQQQLPPLTSLTNLTPISQADTTSSLQRSGGPASFHNGPSPTPVSYQVINKIGGVGSGQSSTSPQSQSPGFYNNQSPHFQRHQSHFSDSSNASPSTNNNNTGTGNGNGREKENGKGDNNGDDSATDRHAVMMDRIENSTTASGSQAPSSFMGASSGISFAKLMFTALHFKENENTTTTTAGQQQHQSQKQSQHSEQGQDTFRKKVVRTTDPSILKKTAENSTIALLPPKQQALELLSLYFAQSNSQLPIFHREEFLRRYFQPIYGDVPLNYSFASNYTSINRESLLNIPEEETWYHEYTRILDEQIQTNGADGDNDDAQSDIDPLKISSSIVAPPKFRKALYFMNIVFSIASTVTHLQYPGHISDNFKNAALRYVDEVYASQDRIESLQGVLTLTLYSLMRPSIPGVWYMLGSALRICVDMGLHHEDSANEYDYFTLDMRRRLFWCCYSLDRQICFYLGRPFGIPEESCNVPFPSDLEDTLIIKVEDGDEEDQDDIVARDSSKRSSGVPSYKCVALTMFKMRQLQAEIQSVLYDKKELSRKYHSLDQWSKDMSLKLDNWSNNAPKTQRKMNCDFSVEFFKLNYYHAKLMLNAMSPVRYTLSLENYLNVADASKEIIFSFYELYSCKLMNYTWAATHNLFMAGSSYLYAIFNCDEVRSRTPLQEIQNVALYCNLILKSLIDKCDAAGTCRDIFEILVAAVIKLRYTPNIINSIDLDNMPSNDLIAKVQPGRHISENLKNLVSTLPNSLQQQEKMMQMQLSQSQNQYHIQQQQQQIIRNEQPIQRSTQQLQNPSNSMPSPHNSNIPHANPVSAPTIKREPDTVMTTATPFEWSTNESDLNRFFEELQNISSPASSVRSSSSALTHEQIRLVAAAQQQHHYQQHQQQQVQPLGHQQVQSVASMSAANPTTSNSPHGSFTSHGSNCSTPGPVTGCGSTVPSSNSLQMQSQVQNSGFNNGQFPQQQLQFSGNWVPSLQTQTQNQQAPLQQPTSIPIGPNGVHGSSFLPPLPFLPQHQMQQPVQLPLPQPQVQSQQQSQPQQQQGNGGMSTSFNSNSNSGSGSTDDSPSGLENGGNESNKKRRRTSKEGQRIYKMINQVPTEGIWEQFFGNGFADL
ncbi:unnamed protein product [Ambrosiozyma monospora]|uniref:Unnamed protein product n=1 Tax=Ambrosiozyma monospora TaxID=43982 RepID=A0A9W6YT08_AMBMO|nr:unnamed protein product [Ambrosiozyma monospora]